MLSGLTGQALEHRNNYLSCQILLTLLLTE